MNWLWIYIAVSVGTIIGFGICSLLQMNKGRTVDYSLSIASISDWILAGETDLLMRSIINRVYTGEKHLAWNPGKKIKNNAPKGE
jgi:hypothetical protein